jgi:hypothetical protein
VDGAEASLRRHLAEAQFVSGELDGRWRMLEITWPFVFFEVTDRNGYPFVLRLECSGYPLAAPTGTFWDRPKSAMLEFRFWPRGTRSNQAFRPDWNSGSALYLPCDRVTITQHAPQWVYEAPTLIWRSNVGVICYLRAVHEILQEHDLTYVKAADSVESVA